MSVVPEDVAVLLDQHGRFLPHVISGVITHHFSAEDREDLEQDIYLALHARKYLDKCRRCEVRYAAIGKPYSFLASLRKFVDRMAKNWLRHRHAMMRDPMLACPLPDAQPEKDAPHARVPLALRVEPTQEDAALASATLDRIRAKLATGRKVIGGVPAVAVFDAAVAEDIDVLNKYERRQLRRAVQESLHAAR